MRARSRFHYRDEWTVDKIRPLMPLMGRSILLQAEQSSDFPYGAGAGAVLARSGVGGLRELEAVFGVVGRDRCGC
jgi:hypothetical protein